MQRLAKAFTYQGFGISISLLVATTIWFFSDFHYFGLRVCVDQGMRSGCGYTSLVEYLTVYNQRPSGFDYRGHGPDYVFSQPQLYGPLIALILVAYAGWFTFTIYVKAQHKGNMAEQKT